MAKKKAKQGSNREKVGKGHPPPEHQFPPGQSGNPAGRPRSRPIASAIKELLDKDDAQAIKALAAVCVQRALKGDFRFAKELLERVDGKVLEELALTQKAEDPLSPEDMELFYEFKSKQAKGEA